jgi:hypothetical protein
MEEERKGKKVRWKEERIEGKQERDEEKERGRHC